MDKDAQAIRARTHTYMDSPIMQNSTPKRMLVACFFSTIVGIILMTVLAHYHLMAVFIGLLLCMCITTPLVAVGKISLETACLVPILILCFIYTPVSWFTFDGLLGCTPYLSILFFAIITLTNYSKAPVLLLSAYAVLMVGLITHWLITWSAQRDMEQIINILVAYTLTTVLLVSIFEAIKRKNIEANRRITDISMRDDLTRLLNRRMIDPVFKQLESAFADQNADYAAIIVDINDFKGINDHYRHRSGDSALQKVAQHIQMSIRSTDYAFRYGGDEFLILIPQMDKMAIQQACARLEAALHVMPVHTFTITVSMGYALRSESPAITALLELADQRMYQAKRTPSVHTH